jgi:hypothetical protein
LDEVFVGPVVFVLALEGLILLEGLVELALGGLVVAV